MPEIEWVDVLSGNVSQVGFDDATKTLYVRFKPSGKVYAYSGVPADVAQDCSKAWSVKSFLTTEIIGRYQEKRIQ